MNALGDQRIIRDRIGGDLVLACRHTLEQETYGLRLRAPLYIGIGSHLGRDDRTVPRRRPTQHRGTGPIAEKHAGRTVFPIDEGRKFFRADDQRVREGTVGNQPLRDFTFDVLGSIRCRERGYFRRDMLEWLWSKYEAIHKTYYGDLLWVFLMLELWHVTQGDRIPRSFNDRAYSVGTH